MSCITPPLEVLSGRAWWPFTGISTVSCISCSMKSNKPPLFVHVGTFKAVYSIFHSFFLLFCVLSRSSLLHADLSESPSPGHVAAPAPPQPLALHHYDPDDPQTSGSSPLISITEVCETRRRSCRSQIGEKTHFTGAQEREMEEGGKTKIHPSVCYFFSWGQDYPTCSHWWLTVFYTTQRTHFASYVQHPSLHQCILHLIEEVSKRWNWPRKWYWR